MTKYLANPFYHKNKLIDNKYQEDEPHDPQSMPEESEEGDYEGTWLDWEVSGIVESWFNGNPEPSLLLKQIEDLDYDNYEMLLAQFYSTLAEEEDKHARLIIEFE
jgi:hypothetical protein